MRRIILVGMGLGLLGAALGCHHTAGVCDCDRPPASIVQAEPPVVPGEPVPAHPPEPVKAPK